MSVEKGGQGNTTDESSDLPDNSKLSTPLTANCANPLDIHIDEENVPCKWGPLTSQCCNVFTNSKVVLFILCLGTCVQGVLVNGLVNVNISTWERRFDLKSTESGLIVGCYDIAVVVCLIPVTYFGGIGSKPRWLGFGFIIIGIGAFVCSIPHFVTGTYEYGNSTAISGVCEVDNSSASVASSVCTESPSSVYKYVFIVGHLLFGIGASPLYTLGVTYLEENVKQKWASMYIGIFFTMAVIGPAVGYVLGGYFLRLDITEVSVSWIGAWWLGFLIFGSFSVFIGLIILGFPPSLPGAAGLTAERVSEAYKGQEGVSTQTAGFGSLKHFPKSLKVLLTNPTFILLNLGGAAEGVVISGIATFIPKYVEYQFNVSASYAALLIGICTVLGGPLGTFCSGYIIKKIKLTLTGLIQMCLITCAVVTVGQLVLLAKCPAVTFAGISHSYNNTLTDFDMMGENSLVSTCNEDCGCANLYFNPVCADNNVMYFTACAAGCRTHTLDTGAKVYHNCRCVAESTESVSEGTARAGRCAPDCKLLIVFMVLFTVILFFSFATGIPEISATLRSVPEQQRSLSLGIQWIIVRCLGNVPGPVLYGTIIDQACLYWHQPCDNMSDGACYFYSGTKLSYYFLAITLGCMCVSLLFYGSAWLVYKPPSKDEATVTDIPQDTNNIRSDTYPIKLEPLH